MSARRAIALVIALALVGAGASCRSNGRTEGARPQQNAGPDVAAPILAGADNGLEVQWWIVADDGVVFARLLSPLTGGASPLAPRVGARWRANGLRLLSTTVDELPALERSAPLLGMVNRNWLGQVPKWTVAVQGDAWETPRSLLIDGELVRLPAGRLRVLTRAWTAPTQDGPRLRVDVAVQHVAAGAARSPESAFGAATLRPVEDEGLVFETLTAELELRDGQSCVIVAEAPEVDWLASATNGATAPGAEEDGPSSAGGEVGPEPPHTPTIGEAMLAMTPLEPTTRRARAVIILTGRVPSRFTLP